MSRAFDRPHRGHVSRSDELFSAALRRGCRGRNRALLPFCTVIDTSTFRGRVARRGRSRFRCVPVCAPKTGRRYDQRRLAQFRCERLVYTGRRSVPAPICWACGHGRCPAQSVDSRGFTNSATPSWASVRPVSNVFDDPPRSAIRLPDELVPGHEGECPRLTPKDDNRREYSWQEYSCRHLTDAPWQLCRLSCFQRARSRFRRPIPLRRRPWPARRPPS